MFNTKKNINEENKIKVMEKVSFDFDSTLDREDVQKVAKRLVERGFEVWITTSRVSDETLKVRFLHTPPDWNKDLYEIANRLGIRRSQIMFTEFEDKIEFLKDKNFLFHLDDDTEELIQILNSKDPCKPINVNVWGWENEINKIIER